MTELSIAVFANSMLLGVLLLLQPLWRDIRHGMAYTVGTFDERKPETVLERRLVMVVRNQIEALSLLLPLAVLLFTQGAVESALLAYAAIAHVASRTLYAVVALAGIPLLRSLFWTVSFAALGVIAWVTFNAVL
ncbi:MAG: MAPEG family protein [Pseudomonadota bacterium]